MKKLIALFLIVFILVAVIAACSSNTDVDTPINTEAPDTDITPPVEDDETPSVNVDSTALATQYGLPQTHLSGLDPVTFTYFTRNHGELPAADNPIIEIIEQITNTKIDIEFHYGDLDIRLGVMLASGDLPDMYFVGNEAASFIDSGHAMALDDIVTMENTPELRAHYDTWWDLMKHTDGRLYTLEIYGTPSSVQPVTEHFGTAFWLQKSVLDHFGRAPNDLDEYFDFIREYKELNPMINDVPTLGFEILANDWFRFCIENPGMFMAGHANWGAAINVPGNNLGDSYGAADRWLHDWNRDYYKKLNDEFLLGTFTGETLSRTRMDYLEAIGSGAVLGMNDQLWNFDSGLDSLRDKGLWERTYLPMDFTWSSSIEPNYIDAVEFTGSNGVNLWTDISDADRAVQYMNYLIHEDVQRFLRWGIEGENYFYNDSGRIERFPVQRQLQEAEDWKADNLGYVLYDLFPKIQGSFRDGNPTDPDESPEEYFSTLSNYDSDLFTKLGIKTQAGLMRSVPIQRPVHYPFLRMDMLFETPEETANQQISEINLIYLSRLISAPEGRFDELWNEYAAAIAEIDQQPIFDFFDNESRRIISAFSG